MKKWITSITSESLFSFEKGQKKTFFSQYICINERVNWTLIILGQWTRHRFSAYAKNYLLLRCKAIEKMINNSSIMSLLKFRIIAENERTTQSLVEMEKGFQTNFTANPNSKQNMKHLLYRNVSISLNFNFILPKKKKSPNLPN